MKRMKEMTSNIEKIVNEAVNEVTKDAHVGRAFLEYVCEAALSGLMCIYGIERFNEKILPDMLKDAIKGSKESDEEYAKFISRIKMNTRMTRTDGEVWD